LIVLKYVSFYPVITCFLLGSLFLSRLFCVVKLLVERVSNNLIHSNAMHCRQFPCLYVWIIFIIFFPRSFHFNYVFMASLKPTQLLSVFLPLAYLSIRRTLHP
jgi:Flp pilus assembly protein protease CpaA